MTEVPFDQRKRSKKMLLNIGLFSIVMMFAGFTSAMIVSMSDGFWVNITLPTGFWYSSAILLLSSVTVFLSRRAAKKNNFRQTLNLTIITFVLGIVFSVLQFKSWGQLIDSGNYMVANLMDLKGEYGTDYSFSFKGEPVKLVDGEFYAESDRYNDRPLKDRLLGSRNGASSYLYVLSGVHWLHVVGGLFTLLRVIVLLSRHGLTPNTELSVGLSSTYWHFVDALWVYLFLFLLFIH
jgi:cytochrome c oxidase subunit 3